MATKTTYTAAATWTASQLADIFRDAFIGAGLMTSWYDSFLSGSVENRVLEVIYDNAKTYGKTYYWFQFTTSGAFISICTGWNLVSDVPTGTQYLDFLSTTTNSTSNHWQLFSSATSTTIRLIRYTSTTAPNQSWFVIENGSNRRCFTITNGSHALMPWMNLDRGCYSGFSYIQCLTGSSRASGIVRFMRGPGLRRELTMGAALAGSTTASNYNSELVSVPIIAYGAVGNANNNITANYKATYTNDNVGAGLDEKYPGTIILPVGFTGTNPSYPSNSNPVFHGMPASPYVVTPLPPDFGISFHYATNNFSVGDTLIVTAGVEEWEILEYLPNSSAVTGASPLFLSRVV